MKVLILGSSGMLGNALQKYLSNNPSFAIYSTTRKASQYTSERYFIVSHDSLIPDLEQLLLEGFDYIINAIGIIRPSDTKEDIYDSFFMNAYFPRILGKVATKYHTRVIHVSTDCVFNGKKGDYSDTDIPDETSVYGMSKFLGEITESPHMTLRTSIIGHELGTQKNLLDWFLSNPDGSTVKGYTNVFWNGVTTLTLAKIIERIMERSLFTEGGLYQIGGESISKYDLLTLAHTIYKKNLIIEEEKMLFSDKTILPSESIIKYFDDLIIPMNSQLEEIYKFYFKST